MGIFGRSKAAAAVKQAEEPPVEPIEQPPDQHPSEQPSTGKASEPAYTVDDWDADSYALMAEGADPVQCPTCGFTGFFGPRALDNKKFRECRFCGFYQEVDQPPGRHRPVTHDCEEWPEAGGAPYIWWIPADERFYECNFCGQRAVVSSTNAFQRGVGVQPPSDDPTHPWWQVPQDKSYSYYYSYWEQWPCTKGRIIF